MLVAICLCQAMSIGLWLHYYLQNSRRDKLLRETTDEMLAALTVENEEYLDRTDKEDFLRFRYQS